MTTNVFQALTLLLFLAAGLAGAEAEQGAAANRPVVSAEAARARRAFGPLMPQISPQGDAIAFSFQGAIWRIPREGGVMRRLTSGPGFDERPAWSPDGKRLVYVSGSAGEVRVIDAASGKLLQAIPEMTSAGKFFFHPNGRRILGRFRSTDPRRGSFGFFDLDTGKLEPIVISSRSFASFALSPDGSQIVFATALDDGRTTPNVGLREQIGSFGPQMDLWRVSAAGGNPTRVMRCVSRIFQLWWSPDRITFSSDAGGAHADLWSLSPDDPVHAKKLTFGQAEEDAPSVSADGRWLVYTDNRENTTSLIVRDLQSGEERPAIPSQLDFGVPTGILRLSVVEKNTRRPLVARVSIQQQDGKFFAPPGALYRIMDNVEHFYCREETELTVPAGKYVIRGFRGLEYREARQEIDVPANATASARIELDHWTDPAARSLWSGESHIHANYGHGAGYNTPDTMRLQIEGEGLNVANLVVANSDGDGVYDREFFRGAPDPVSAPTTILYWNEEFRATLWGHMTFLGLTHLVEPIFTGFPGTTNPWDFPTNGEVGDQVHLQNGVVIYTHPGAQQNAFVGAYTAKGLPVDVALGKIDSLDINYDGFESIPLWYALLNCGFRLGASAGTDVLTSHLRSSNPGRSRAYVKIDGPLSYQAWANGVRDGRAFVTNGPMLEFSAAGHPSGDTIRLPAAGEIPVRGTATWQSPLDRAEVVYNGEVIATAVLSADRRSATLDQKVRIARSGWLSFRAHAGRSTQAHTSAVYIEVAGKPAGSRKDAQAFLEWIDRLEARLRERDRLPSAAIKARVQGHLDGARAIYREIAARDIP